MRVVGKLIITVDGPAGSGKSTIANMLARRFGLKHLSSGKIYRTIAFFERKYGLEKALELVEKIKFGENGEIIFDRESIDAEISDEEIGKRASEISKIPKVREKSNEIQRKIVYGDKSGFVVDGRDEGTAVFKEAEIKIYLDASLEERARRKLKEAHTRGELNKDMKYFIEKISERDKQDMERDISPLKIPDDAIYIDSTGLNPENVLEKILEEIRKRKPEILHFWNVDLK